MDPHAGWYGGWGRKTLGGGLYHDLNEIGIAATAMHHRVALMTFDARLQKIPGLEIIV
ncbi:MAG TPA: hypothetical protein VIK19_01870 [Syntrophales bacterium]